MFVGLHERQLDDKGRLALPSAFRADFGDACYLVYGEERCIDVFPRASASPRAAAARAEPATSSRRSTPAPWASAGRNGGKWGVVVDGGGFWGAEWGSAGIARGP